MEGDTDALVVAEPQVIDRLADRYDTVLRQIKLRAPNARVVLVGYPRVVKTGARRTTLECTYFSDDTVTWFASMGARLNSVAAQAAARAGAGFYDPTRSFIGHEACNFNADTPEWINALQASSDSGSGTNRLVGVGSFHKKPTGHDVYVREIRPLM